MLIEKTRSKKLYRYTQHINETYRDVVITKQFLWFSKPDDFNDPLDSRLDYRQVYSAEEIENFWQEFLKSKLNHPQSLEEVLSCWGENDKFVEQQNRTFNQFRSQMGVCCFSATPTNILMWSHYANNHKGIVYEFEPDLFLDSLSDGFTCHPMRVDYAKHNEYELLSYASTGKPKQDQFVTEQLTKAKDWEYEQEYLFIDLKGNGNKSFKKESLKSVIFGAKTPSEEIDRFKHLCQRHGYEYLQFKQARFLQGKFEIGIEDIV